VVQAIIVCVRALPHPPLEGGSAPPYTTHRSYDERPKLVSGKLSGILMKDMPNEKFVITVDHDNQQS
jgi:hypothetical protein